MTLFNFKSTEKYKEIITSSTYKSNFKKIVVTFLITFSLGIIAGLFFSEHTISAVKYVAIDSGSAQAINATAGSPILSLIVIFFNNLLIAGLLIVLPVHLFNIQRQSTDNWTKSSILEKINPSYASYVMIAFQMFMVGNFIGYAIPIVNNITKVVAALFPHGVIEIPIILISAAIGMSFATKEINSKFAYNDCLNFFVKRIIPVMLLAAFIEAFITPAIIGLI